METTLSIAVGEDPTDQFREGDAADRVVVVSRTSCLEQSDSVLS